MKNFTVHCNVICKIKGKNDAELSTSKTKFYFEKALFTNRYSIFIAHVMTSGKY